MKILGTLGISTKTLGFFRTQNYDRHKKDEPFDWERIGSLINGTTWIQPDELDEILRRSGKWLNDNYNVMNHNCHDFVKECLIICGANEGMTKKLNATFRPHK